MLRRLATTDKVTDTFHDGSVGCSGRSIVVLLLLEQRLAATMAGVLDTLLVVLTSLNTTSAELTA
jgi:hypothetical protein